MKNFTKAAAVALPAALCLVVAGTIPSLQASADEAAPAARAGAAPALLRASTARDLPVSGAGAVQGTRRLVTLDASLLPGPGASRELRMSSDESLTARIDRVVQERDFTSWQGSLVGQTGLVSLVEADGVYRGYISTSEGVQDISSAGGDQYWLTDRAPLPAPVGDDRELVGGPHSSVSGAVAQPAATSGDAGGKGKKGKGKKGKAKVTVLFGYTKETLAIAGGKPQLKAAAALAVADTNLAFANSGVRAKVKYKGIVKAKGKESNSQAADYQRLFNRRNGAYDNLTAAQARKGADVVHLFLSGKDSSFCGRGSLPYAPRYTNPVVSVSVSNLDCLSNLTPTHEIGHNLGADHNRYPGVTHSSFLKFATGLSDPAHGFITVMSYFTECNDLGIYCINIPAFSSKKGTFNGVPTGSKKLDNARAINLTAPRVARYRR